MVKPQIVPGPVILPVKLGTVPITFKFVALVLVPQAFVAATVTVPDVNDVVGVTVNVVVVCPEAYAKSVVDVVQL